MYARFSLFIVLIGFAAWSFAQSIQSAPLNSDAFLKRAPNLATPSLKNKAIGGKIGGSLVALEEELHEFRARQVDDEGTTGEVIVVASTSTGGSGSSAQCLPAAPQLSQSGTSVTATYTDPCGSSRKRQAHDFTLRRADGSSGSYSSVFETSETSWTHTDNGLTAGQSYSYKVCDYEVCGPATSITISGGASAAQSDNSAAGAASAGLAPWLIGLIVAIIVLIIIAIIIAVIIIRRRKNRKDKKPVVAEATAPVGVMPAISVSSDDEDVSVSEDEWYRTGGLEEEARARDFNEIIGEYKAHRVLKRKGESDSSDSWDDADEEEWARLSKAAVVIQSFWRGYLVRHPRAGPMAASRVEYLSQLVNGFSFMDEQSMFDMLESIQRASRDIWEEDEVPADIADAINLLALAARNLLSIEDKDSEEYKAAEAAFLAQKKLLEERLALYASGDHAQNYKHRTRSWSAFKNLLREYRNKKAVLEQTPNSEAAQKELLEQFRTHCEGLLPSDDMDTEESENSDSMDSQSSSASSGSWQDMKAMLQKYRNGRLAQASGAEPAPVSRAKMADRWKDRAAILDRLESALSEGNKDKLRGIKAVPKPDIHLAEISEAEANPLENAPMPWQERHTGSKNVTFDEEESDDSSDASDSGDSSAESSNAENSVDSTGSRASGFGSPLMKVQPLKFNRRMLRPRGNKEEVAAVASRRRGTGLASDSSGNSSTSPENSSEMSLDDASQDVPAVASEANQMPVSNSPRVLRRRVRKSGDGSSVVSRASAAEQTAV